MDSLTDAVVVVGAGVAGLGAAAALRAAGRNVIVIEASGHVGGRAWTTRPAALGGMPFDHGAQWLHMAEHNPLAKIARNAGETLVNSNRARRSLLWLDGRFADDDTVAEYWAAWEEFERIGMELAQGPDQPLTAVADRMMENPAMRRWAPTIEAWEGPVIDAAEADRISLHDWAANALSGGNLVLPDGLGDFVQRRLLPLAGDVRLSTPATRVRWGGPGVAVETPSGTISAAAVIVTVSTAVITGGSIAFDPPLPEPVQTAAHALPLGLAIKIGLHASGDDRIDLPDFVLLQQPIRVRGEPFALVNFWPFGRPVAMGWIGGPTAWTLAREGDAAAEDYVRTLLRKVWGGRADRAFAPGAVVTGWDRDPHVGGAYSNALPGHAGARAVLAAPLAGGRLIFAGEACHTGAAGTVGGAWDSGQHAAAMVMQAIGV
jgi:monoamine oxidase